MSKPSKQQLGGFARAKSLTPERRREIARMGAEAAHRPPQALYDGKLDDFGNMECAVLPGEVRVLSQSAVLRAFGLPRPAKGRNLVAANIASYMSAKARRELVTPIEYLPKHGGRSAHGVRAYLLSEICDAYAEAAADGKLRTAQKPAATAAAAMRKGLGAVGIDALVDEATGYQTQRRADALRDLLREYVADVYLPSTEKFPREFFDNIYRLRGWEERPDSKRFRVVGKWINQFIYENMPPKVLEELKKKTPVSAAGNKTKRLWQSLTELTGVPHLDRRVAAINTLMTDSDTWTEFTSKVERHDERMKKYQKD